MPLVDFVDVSMYQGDIDWLAVPCPAVIKATEGATYTDPRFAQNQAGARCAGKAMGWYHFLSSQSAGAAQAAHFLDTVQPLPDELLCLDWETDSSGVRPDPEQAKAWIDMVRACGWSQVRLYGNEWLAAYALQWEVPFWCAWYGDAEQQVRDRDAVAWQWSSEQYVDGIAGRVDVNMVLDPARWEGEHMPSAEEIAQAVWAHQLTKTGRPEDGSPASQWVLWLHDELTKPGELQQRLVTALSAALPPGSVDAAVLRDAVDSALDELVLIRKA